MELYISNDGEHWGYEEEMHGRNDDLERERMREAEDYAAQEAAYITPHTEEKEV